MAQPVLEDKDFQAGLSYAKGIAKKNDATELTPQLLLFGFLLAKRAGKLSTMNDNLTDREAEIEKAALAVGVKLPEKITPIDHGALPTNKLLRELLKDHGGNCEDLLVALFGLLDENFKAKRTKEFSIDDMSKEDGFNDIIHYASTLAEGKGYRDISSEVLTAGAFFAYRDGLLISRPSIRAHLSAHEPSIKALLDARSWVPKKPTNAQKKLPLDGGVQDILKEVEEDGDPLVRALNAGIISAAKILGKKRVAFHEAGHAVVSAVLQPGLRIAEVTIIEKEDADGYVAYDTTSPYFSTVLSREDFLDKVCVSLAGRVSEQKKYGHDEIDAGAVSDLEAATRMAWDAITKYGLDFEFGPVNLEMFYKSGIITTGWLFDAAQRRLQEVLKEGLQKTETLIAENWGKVEAVALVLYEKKKLTEDDLLGIMASS